jgi:imidazolonepropionase-like amidohydrolase
MPRARRLGRPALLAAMAALVASPTAAATGRVAPYLADLFPSTYSPPAAPETLIVHAIVLDGAGHRLDDGQVLMGSGKIIAIGHDLKAPGARLIDARGRWVTPGIIDIHSHDGTYHLPQTAIDAEASDVAELSDPNTAGVWIESGIDAEDLAFAHALASGVTTLQVLPGSTPVFGGRTVVLHPVPALTVQAMKMPGAPQGEKMACGENPKTYDVEKGRGPTSAAGEVTFIRDAFAKARTYKAKWDRYLAGETADAPEDDPRLDTLAAMLEGKIAAHIHCYRASEMAIWLDLARDIGFRIAAFHHAVEGYKIAPLLVSRGVCAVVWSDWWGFKVEAVDGIRENAAFIDAAGGCVMMHSDGPFLGQWLNVEAGKAAAAGRRAGLALPPEHVIAWLTSNPAKAMGLADRIGALAPGLDADLVVWSGDPFSVYTHADLVFIDGAVRFDRSQPPPAPDFQLGRAPTP